MGLRDFLHDVKMRIINAKYGYRASDKLKLLLHALIRSTPRRLRRRIGSIHHSVARIEAAIASVTVLSVFGLRYNVVDSASLRMAFPTYEDWVWRFMKLKEGDVFVDIGAHIGKFTCTVARIVGEKGLVVAAEPNPANYAVLVRNVRRNGLRNVKALMIAAYDRDCKIRLFVGDSSDLHSVKRNMGFGSIEVSAKKLDGVLLDEFRLGRVDWVKIDAEASEYEVLKGMIQTLTRFKSALIVEVWRENMDSVVQLLEILGYQLTPIKGTETDELLHLLCK